MNVDFKGSLYPFRPWRPADGTCMAGLIAFDTETTRIDDSRPWLAPAYVLGAAFDGSAGFFVTREHLEAFLAAHAGNALTFHNTPFDLDVIHTLAPAAGVYDRVDAGRVWDTQLLHRLLTLGEAGHVSHGHGESTLGRCAETYLGASLAKDTVDSAGNLVRLSYGKWLTRPLREMEPCYLRYLAEDVIATRLVCRELLTRTERLLRDASATWGFVSADWLAECGHRFGPQTHHIQLKAAVVLRAVTANGLCLDTRRQGELARGLEALAARQKDDLRGHGYIAGGKGAGKALQTIMRRLADRNPGRSFPATEAGAFATGRDALQDLADAEPFVKLLLEYKATEKLLKAFVGKLAKAEVHPTFNPLARTGRTTSSGDINAQNLPKRDDVRACFVPRPGHDFIDADYVTLELTALAQVCLSQFGWKSKMAEAINAGVDLHRLVAGRVLGKPPTAVSKVERQKAKAVNFGKPGGMGDEALAAYAKANYGVQLTPADAAALSDSWFDLFPEMQAFLADAGDTPAELAALLGLTPAAYAAATGDGRYARGPAGAARAEEPLDILGMMLLKAVRVAAPVTGNGRPYSPDEIEFFFARLETVLDKFPACLRQAVTGRAPSKPLQRAVMGLVGRAGVFTLTGRLRAAATYTARHNTVFQGLAADGAKLALWRLWRAGYRVVNFIHDQVLVEVPADDDLKPHAECIKGLMVAGMQEVVPDVRVDVSYAAAARWYTGAEAVFDAAGRLLLWEPEKGKLRGTAA